MARAGPSKEKRILDLGCDEQVVAEQLRSITASRASPESKLTRNWSYPRGQKQPALVLFMNEYVDDRQQEVYIPGEIALCSFTIEEGVNSAHYWTLVDPGTNIPLGHGAEAYQITNRYGLPQPSFAKKYQDYHGMVAEIEKFIQTAGGEPISSSKDEANKSTNDTEYFIFCSKVNVEAYTRGLKWLYAQAKLSFPHRILSLESLLVVLSLGGLETLAKRHIQKKYDFLQVLYHYETTISKAFSTISLQAREGRATITSKEKLAVNKTVHDFMNFVALSHTSRYEDHGLSLRQASKYPERYPYAILGAFIFEEQATRYLKHMDYVHFSELSCPYHQDKTRTFPDEISAWASGKVTHDQAVNKMIQCALLNAQRQIYLALDVMMVNYRIKPLQGKHYPKEQV